MWVWFLTSNITDNSDMAGSSPRGTKKTHLTTIRFLCQLLGGRLAFPLHALIFHVQSHVPRLLAGSHSTHTAHLLLRGKNFSEIYGG